MVLLRQSSKIYDSLRKKWIKATPEERVRQKWVVIMTQQLAFPRSLLSLEKTLEEASFQTKNYSFPNRRLDLICYSKNEQGNLIPLLLMEFKAEPLREGAFEQIIRYNTYVGAKYLAVASEDEVMTGVYDLIEKRYHFISRLPNYHELKNDLAL